MTQEKKKETKDAEGFVEIPFGAFDSETIGWTYTIPEGFVAKIEDGKIIVEKQESDDEKIRKELIDFIQWAEDRGRTRHDYHQAKRPAVWIAYLKKQKEQRPAEWNEQDKKMRDAILQDLANIKAAYPKVNIQEEFDWLKSLRPQQKYEWSEANEKDLIQLIENGVTEAICKKGFNFHFEDEYAKELVEYIKTFNARPHWKPSEEQINALAKAIITLGEQGDNKTVMHLNEIRTELKKL